MLNAFVHVIESPSDSDLLDGRTEGRSLCEVLQLAGIPRSYSLATTASAFREALTSRLNEAATFHQKLPILHFSTHGNVDGIQITSGDVFSWTELRRAIDPISNAMNGALLVCMSSCNGASGCRMAMHQDDDHPFWALVGNSQEVLWADAAVAYITFYHSFFKGAEIEDCVSRMRLASGDSNFMVFSGAKVKADWAEYARKTYLDGLVKALQQYGSQTPQTGGLLGGAA